MKNTTMLGILVFVILIVGTFVFFNSGQAGGSTNVVAQQQLKPEIQKGEVQRITLGMSNYNYNPNTITVNANQPVEITIDSSVKGCLRAFAIPDLKVNEFSRSPEEKITFTPTKAGTFTFMCSMGMGRGKMNVIP